MVGGGVGICFEVMTPKCVFKKKACQATATTHGGRCDMNRSMSGHSWHFQFAEIMNMETFQSSESIHHELLVHCEFEYYYGAFSLCRVLSCRWTLTFESLQIPNRICSNNWILLSVGRLLPCTDASVRFRSVLEFACRVFVQVLWSLKSHMNDLAR